MLNRAVGGKSVVSKVLWVFATALAVAPAASGEIFKCTAKDGLALYQNFPCEINSLGSLPSALSAPVDAGKARLNTATAEKPAMSVQTRGLPAEPRVGMASEEVKALWGEPVETIQDEPVTGRIEIWRYADGRSVQFNNKHRVLAVQQ